MTYELTANGLQVPTEAEIIEAYQAAFLAQFGSDLNVDVANPDSVAGRLIGILAERERAIGELLQAVYASFRPSSAVGEALDALAEFRGGTRNGAVKTTADVTLTGSASLVVPVGTRYATSAGVEFVQTETVTLSGGGTGTAAVQAAIPGATVVEAGDIDTIVSVVAGLTGVTNAADGVTGQDEEQDASLRVRLDGIGSKAGINTRASIAASLQDLTGLSYGECFENDTGETDANGIPAQSLAPVVYPAPGVGTDLEASIAAIILASKGGGGRTFGSTGVDVDDSQGKTHTVYYTSASTTAVAITATVSVLPGYTAEEVKAAIEAAITTYFSTRVQPGQDFLVNRAVSIIGSVEGVDEWTVSAPASDVSIAYNEVAVEGTHSLTVS